MSKRPTRNLHRDVDAVSINITPVMNLFVVLIPFLLISAAFVQLSTVDSQLPKIATAEIIEKKKEKDKLVVTVHINARGFAVGRLSGVSGDSRWGKGGNLSGFIRKDRYGKFDFKDLNEQMYQIKNAYPDAISVILFPSGDTSYDALIQSMDATREFHVKIPDGEKEKIQRVVLFPDAVIGHISEDGVKK